MLCHIHNGRRFPHLQCVCHSERLSRDVPRLAKNPPALQNGNTPPNPRYTLLRSFQFYREIWKGYEHRMTKGERAHGKGTTGEGGEDRTWEFCLKDES